MSGFNEFDPLRKTQEEYHERRQWELERRLGGLYEWKHLIVGCLLSVVVLFVAASIVGWAIATFVVK